MKQIINKQQKLNIMTTENYKVIDTELMAQKQVTGYSGKIYNTVADEVVGKWFAMIQLESGIVGTATNKCKEIAILEAVKNAQNN